MLNFNLRILLMLLFSFYYLGEGIKLEKNIINCLTSTIFGPNSKFEILILLA